MVLAGAGRVHAQDAAVEGTVLLPTNPPPVIPVQRYHLKADAIAPMPPRVAVVYLDGKFPVPAAPPATLKLIQQGFQFSARVLPVRAGTRVEFPNQDAEYHNVFSYSKSKRFDLGRYRRNETPPALVFEQPGVVSLYCDIHEHMRSVILVLDTPHFVATAPDGKFRLAGLPEGDFTVKAWIDERTTRERRVSLKIGQTVRVDFSTP